MAKEVNNLSNKTLEELISLRKAAIIIAGHYENYAKANEGNYPFDSERIFNESRDKYVKYQKIVDKITSEIEKRLEDELA